MSSPPGSFFHVTPTPEFILMLIGLIVIPMALTIISWMAFAHLDKASEKRWKNYLLVEGGVLAFFFVLFMFQILASQYTDYFSFLIIVPLLASAVLFILAFALKPVVRK
jgi:hypothetical protein